MIMRIIEKTKTYKAIPEIVFGCLDDLGVTGMHMSQSSMPLMGGKMDLEFLTPQKTGLHTKYRWTGKVLWWPLDFSVEVTEWVRGRKKTWETIGSPEMVIFSWFRMKLRVEEIPGGSIAYLSIGYKKAKGFFNKIICSLVGDWYSRWCLRKMLTDSEAKINTLVSSV